MKVRVTGLAVIALAAVAAAVGCTNTTGNPVAPIKSGATPVPASPTPVGSSVPATATPTPRPGTPRVHTCTKSSWPLISPDM